MKIPQDETDIKLESHHMLKEKFIDSEDDITLEDDDTDVTPAHITVTSPVPLAIQSQALLPTQTSIAGSVPPYITFLGLPPALATTTNKKSGADYVIKKLHDFGGL